MTHPTKQRLLDAGIEMLLRRGYNDLGIESVLSATRIPRGSFYHHFGSKEDFALAAVDAYMVQVHAAEDDQSARARHACSTMVSRSA